MKPKIERPYKKKNKWDIFVKEFSICVNVLRVIVIMFVMFVVGFVIIEVDNMHKSQLTLYKTMTDAMDQLMEIRFELDEIIYELEEIKAMQEINTYPLSASDRSLIEGIVMSEARGEPFAGQMAVAQVIRNRSELWGESIEEVCLAPNQFAPPYRGETSESVRRAVWEVSDQGNNVFGEPITHFHAEYVSPRWAETKINRGSIGRHIFWGN